MNATVLGSKNAKGDDEQTTDDKEVPEAEEPEGDDKSNETA